MEEAHIRIFGQDKQVAVLLVRVVIPNTLREAPAAERASGVLEMMLPKPSD